MTSNRILIVAGGTGGHVMPALAVCNGLSERGFDCKFLTDLHGRALLEKIAPEQNVSIISASSPISGNILKKVISLYKLSFGVIQSIFYIARFRPFCIVGFGGYPSAPPLIAANIYQLPGVLHEQNARVGRANLFLATHATTMLVSWKNSKPLPKNTTVKLTGLPVRNVFFELASYQEKSEFNTANPCHILVIGGSLGAEVFAKLIPDAILNLPEKVRRSITITQQVRSEQQSELEAAYSAMSIKHFCNSFFPKIPDEMAKADIIISRAGAASVAEIAATGRAAIFIPFPGSLDDHQTLNAKSLTDENAAILVTQKEAESVPQILTKELLSLITNPQKCKQMASKASELAHKDALKKIIVSISSYQKASVGSAK